MTMIKRLLSITSCIATCMLLSFMASCTQEESEGPIDGTITDENGPITLELTGHTATTAKFSGTVNLDQFSDLFSLYEEVGIIYSLREDLEVTPLITFAVPITTLDKNNRFEKTMTGLLHGTKYYYSSYVCANGIYKFGEVQSFTTDDVTIEISEPIVTSTTATFKGKVKIADADLDAINFGVAWKDDDDFDAGVKEICADIEVDGSFAIVVKDLKMDTEYYYASYVSQVGSKYGEVKKFTTTAVDMSISASNITQASVTFTGQASRNDADKEIEYGVLFSTSEDLNFGSSECIRKSLTEYFDADGSYTMKVDGLTNDTKYFYRWYARQGSEYKYGQIHNFTTSSVSINLSVDPITQTTATFKGNYEQPDGEGFEIGVVYSTSSSNLTDDSVGKIVLSKNNFSHKVSGLKYNTTYYYCYYVCQKDKLTYGSVQEFKTQDVPIEVSVSDITQTTATFIGQTEITESGAIEVGILYSSNSSLSLSSSSTKLKKLNNGNFSFTAEGLTNNTKYYYKYYIKQGDDYVYGERMDFTTTSISATLNQPSVTQTTATFSGKANFSDIGSIEFGILYSTSESLSVNSSGVNQLKVDSLSGGEFSCKAEGLTYSTKYYYCYYACQDGSYIYGKVDTFTTASVSVNLSVDAVTQTTATFNGSVELTEDGLIEVGVLYSTGNTLTVGANGVTKQVLTPDSSGNVSFKAEGLQYSTKYNYCYYVCQNGKYIYGNIQKFTTSSINVILIVRDITQTTATFQCTTKLTEVDLIEVGILYSTGNNLIVGTSGVNKHVLNLHSSNIFKAENLQYGTTYNYCYYIRQNEKYTYGKVESFTTSSVNMSLSVDTVTQTTVSFNGNVELTEDGLIEVGVLYSTSNDLTEGANEVTKQVLTPDSSGNVSLKAEDLQHGTTYNYCYYIRQNEKYTYGKVESFTTSSVNMNLSVDAVTQTTATFNGSVELTEDGLIEVGVLYSKGNNLTVGASGVTKQKLDPDSSGMLYYFVEDLQFATNYYFCSYICQNGIYRYGPLSTFATIEPKKDLSKLGTANCYIISQSGTYKIKAVKGNSDESVGDVFYSDILWESFGTSNTPNVGDLVSYTSYLKDGYIGFTIPSNFKEGNAVVAAKDINGEILWSWHIWITDIPQEHIYTNNAGTMMDRNLGATSATPGDVEAIGLLYQWGRKDPFLGSASISNSLMAKSSITWPSSVSSSSSNGTNEYATANPTTLIRYNRNNFDWYYSESSSTDNTRWATSETAKSIYDPCPEGWRVPDREIWQKGGFDDTKFDKTNLGISFNINDSFTAWYPSSGWYLYSDGKLCGVGSCGGYWSASPYKSLAYVLTIDDYGFVDTYYKERSHGCSVRCIKELK